MKQGLPPSNPGRPPDVQPDELDLVDSERERLRLVFKAVRDRARDPATGCVRAKYIADDVDGDLDLTQIGIALAWMADLGYLEQWSGQGTRMYLMDREALLGDERGSP